MILAEWAWRSDHLITEFAPYIRPLGSHLNDLKLLRARLTYPILGLTSSTDESFTDLDTHNAHVLDPDRGDLMLIGVDQIGARQCRLGAESQCTGE